MSPTVEGIVIALAITGWIAALAVGVALWESWLHLRRERKRADWLYDIAFGYADQRSTGVRDEAEATTRSLRLVHRDSA